MEDELIFIQGPKKGVYYLNRANTMQQIDDLLFISYGVKSNGISVIIPSVIIKKVRVSSIKKKITDTFNKIDRIFFLCPNRDYAISLKYEIGCYFKNITKNILYLDIPRWASESKIKPEQKKWYSKVYEEMCRNKKFLLGQIEDRLTLKKYETIAKREEEELNNLEKTLKQLKEPQEAIESNIKNIKNMKWIDKISLEGNDLSILTKAMACTYVPNIGEFIEIEKIKKADILYRMMKYQLMGKYFIILTDYYKIKNDFSIKADRNTRYPYSKVRSVAISNTYFRGQACHIGNEQACLGELSAAIGQAGKTGLDMLLMSFEAYLRSINLVDTAGQRYWCLPMGDADGNIEVWPYVEDLMKRSNSSFKDLKRNLEGYEDIMKKEKFDEIYRKIESRQQNGKLFAGECRYLQDPRRNMGECIKLIKDREPLLFEELKKKGAFSQWQ